LTQWNELGKATMPNRLFLKVIMGFSGKLSTADCAAFFADCCPRCPRCGSSHASAFGEPPPFYRPWKMAGRHDVLKYANSLAEELREWLLVFFVDDELGLLAAETVGRGSVGEIQIDCAGIVRCGLKLGAAGLILVHNHPSGDPTPSRSDIEVTKRLARISRDMEVPLLDHFVVAKSGIRSVGFW